MADTIIDGCKYEELTLEYDDFSLKQVHDKYRYTKYQDLQCSKNVF